MQLGLLNQPDGGRQIHSSAENLIGSPVPHNLRSGLQDALGSAPPSFTRSPQRTELHQWLILSPFYFYTTCCKNWTHLFSFSMLMEQNGWGIWTSDFRNVPSSIQEICFNFCLFWPTPCFSDYFPPLLPPVDSLFFIYFSFKILSGAWDIQPPFPHPNTAEKTYKHAI